MIELASTMVGEQTIDPTKAYLVDFSKMQNVNDLVLVLSALGISIQGNHPFINELKPFLNLNNPIQLGPQIKEVQLPKLKKAE